MIRKFSCFYKTLEISTTADKTEIKNAFYRLAKVHHPDQSKNSGVEFGKLKQAYDVLMDDEQRYNYDLNQGYLNAVDIDKMEDRLKRFGSRYMSDKLRDSFNQIDDTFENISIKITISERKSFRLNQLFILRMKFGFFLVGGFLFTYNLSIFVIETYIYPTKPTNLK